MNQFFILMLTFVLNAPLAQCLTQTPKKTKIKKSDIWTARESFCPTEKSTWITQLFVGWSVPYRAHKMIPPELEVRQSTISGAGLGVFARTFLPAFTWLGEYEGEGELVDSPSLYRFTITRGGETLVVIDGQRPETSSWTRWLNTPRNEREENVDTMRCKGRVFFMTNKDVLPGTELMFYYGDQYSYSIGIIYRGWLHEFQQKMLAQKTTI